MLNFEKSILCLLAFLQVLYCNVVYAQSPVMLISGTDKELEQNIRAHVSLPSLDCDAQMRSLNSLLPDIKQHTLRAGHALGYYFLTTQVAFSRDNECWSLSIEVVPGEPMHIENVEVKISGDTSSFSEMLNNLAVSKGDQVNHKRYERIKSDLSARAVELGFFAAKFENSQLLLDLQKNTADIAIEFDTSERYRFGAIEIAPIEALSEDFIRRYISFDEDVYYSADALLDLQNSLSSSLYFSAVTVTPALDREVNRQIPVQIGLQMLPRRVYSLGGGVTTDIGPRVRMDYEDRYLNRSGHTFALRSSVSPVQQGIDMDYGIPLKKPATEKLSFLAGWLDEDNDTFTSQTFKLGTNYGFINRFGWRQNYFLNFQHDNFVDADRDDESDLLISGVNITRTRADDAIYPMSGWRLFAQIRGASDTVLSSTSFLQFNINGKLIKKFGPGRVLLKFEAATSLLADLDELPVSVQYFTGGDQSVRGYKYRSLGPLNEDNEVIGGKHLLVGGVEYDFNILPNWKLALFVDAGNAFSDFNEYDLKKSAGIGVRWLSPIGPIRFDLASAFDDDNKLRLHITMGPDL